jgi:hypothetical protein
VTSLPGLSLFLPQFPNWDETITVNEAEGAARPLSLCLAWLKQAAERTRSADATPENVAWLLFWTRLFEVSDNTIRALDQEASFTLGLLDRVAFEVSTQFSVVARPLIEYTQPDPSNPFGWALREQVRRDLSESIRQRLRGYLAWALYSDIQSYEDQLRPQYLREIFNPESARRLAELEAEETWSGWYREVEVLSDQEAALDRRRAENHVRMLLDRTREWYSVPELEAWRNRIAEITRTGDRNNSQLTLFEVLDEKGTTIGKALRSLKIGWAYQTYAESSALIHGSTMKGYLQLSSEGSLVPKILGVRGDPDELAGRIADQLHWPTFGLGVVQQMLGI